jgi:hypothetical protein
MDELVERHEALRTSFREVKGEVMQIITPDAAVVLQPVDLRNVPRARRSRALGLIARGDLERGIALEQAPLARGRSIRLGAEDHLFWWVVPHTIWDAASEEIFVREFVQLYGAHADGRAPQLRHLPIQLPDVAASERDPQVLASAHWRRRVGGTTSGRIDLPTSRPRAELDSYQAQVVELPAMSRGLVEDIDRLALRAAASRSMVLFAVLAAVLSPGRSENELTIAITHENRDRSELEGVLGCLVDVLPVRICLGEACPFERVVERTRDAVLDAYANKAPGALLLELLGEPCDVMLNVQYERRPFGEGEVCGGVTFQQWRPERWWLSFPARAVWYGALIDVNLVYRSDGSLGGDLTYNGAALTKSFAAALASDLVAAIHRVVGNPDVPVGCLSNAFSTPWPSARIVRRPGQERRMLYDT